MNDREAAEYIERACMDAALGKPFDPLTVCTNCDPAGTPTLADLKRIMDSIWHPLAMPPRELPPRDELSWFFRAQLNQMAARPIKFDLPPYTFRVRLS